MGKDSDFELLNLFSPFNSDNCVYPIYKLAENGPVKWIIFSLARQGGKIPKILTLNASNIL